MKSYEKCKNLGGFGVSGHPRSSATYSAGLMPTEARGNYLPEAPYLRETKCIQYSENNVHGAYVNHDIIIYTCARVD